MGHLDVGSIYKTSDERKVTMAKKMREHRSIPALKNGTPEVTEEQIKAFGDGVSERALAVAAGGPAMSNTELKALFKSYDKATADVEKSRKELEAALAVRSEIVEQIAAGAGRGPFGYKGQVLTVVCRESKSTGEKTWFFKGPSKSDLVEVG
jgi:hypothetical protein